MYSSIASCFFVLHVKVICSKNMHSFMKEMWKISFDLLEYCTISPPYHSFSYKFTHQLTHQLTHQFTHQVTHQVTHQFAHQFSHQLAHQFAHLLTQLKNAIKHQILFLRDMSYLLRMHQLLQSSRVLKLLI